MKILKALSITLIAVLLTGCYTQLQYSQKMKKITDDKPKKAAGYTYSGDQEKAEQEPVSTQEKRAEEQYQQESTYAEDYVPIHYKDYEYAEKYDECRCSPYNVYNVYGSHYDWYGYGYDYPHYSHGSYFSISPYYYSRWHHRRFFGGPYFAVTFSWGSPFYYHSFYYDSFYDPNYGPYWYRYRSPFAYNYHKYYGSFGYGYYSGGKAKIDRNTRYGPRSIGNNRVGNSSVRSRGVRSDGRRATVGNSSSTRTRSVGTSRTTTNRTRGTKVERTRNRGSQSQGNNGNSRSRNRGEVDIQDSRDRIYIDRTNQSSDPVIIDQTRSVRVDRSRTIDRRDVSSSTLRRFEADQNATLRSRLERAPRIELGDRRFENQRPTFFNRMRTFFKNNTSRIGNDFNGRTIIRNRTSSDNRSSVGRSNNGSSRTKVTRSRSSSNSTKSRSRGGSSRSRSGGDSDSGSDRDRGN